MILRIDFRCCSCSLCMHENSKMMCPPIGLNTEVNVETNRVIVSARLRLSVAVSSP